MHLRPYVGARLWLFLRNCLLLNGPHFFTVVRNDLQCATRKIKFVLKYERKKKKCLEPSKVPEVASDVCRLPKLAELVVVVEVELRVRGVVGRRGRGRRGGGRGGVVHGAVEREVPGQSRLLHGAGAAEGGVPAGPAPAHAPVPAVGAGVPLGQRGRGEHAADHVGVLGEEERNGKKKSYKVQPNLLKRDNFSKLKQFGETVL